MALSNREMHNRDFVADHVRRIGRNMGAPRGLVDLAIGDAYGALRDGKDVTEALRMGVAAVATVMQARRPRPKLALVPRETVGESQGRFVRWFEASLTPFAYDLAICGLLAAVLAYMLVGGRL